MSTNLTKIIEQIEEIQDFIDGLREGKTVYIKNPNTGEKRQATNDENLSFIQDRILFIAMDLDGIKDKLSELVELPVRDEPESK